MTELKPCPFCGGTKFWIENRNIAGIVPQWVVTCVSCFRRGKPRTTQNKAIEVWNKGVNDIGANSTM